MSFVTTRLRQRRILRAFFAILPVYVGMAVIVFYVAMHQERDELMHSTAQAMMSAVAQRAQSLEEQIALLSSDVRFLSRIQTVSGLVRAMNNRGIDKEGGISAAVWQSRLQNTFEKFAAENPHLMSIRFLSVLDDGREMVRVERRQNDVWSTPATQLLAQGNREDFALMANLRADTVAISLIHLEHLNRASGVDHEQGQIPALLAGMPVFSESGQLTGMVEVSLDLRGLLAHLRNGSEPGFKIYLINDQGDYLLDPERKQTSGIELARRWQDEHDPLPDSPGLPQGLRDFSSAEGLLHTVMREVVLDEHEPGRYFTIVIAVLDSVIASQAAKEGIDTLLMMFGVSIVLGGIAYFYRREHLRVTAKQSELAAIVESSRDAIIGKTLTGIVTTWNPAAEQMFGYTAAEAIGKRLADLIMPEANRDQEPEVLARICQGEMVFERQTVRRHKHGRLLDVSVIVSPIYAADGAISGAATNLRDISEQRTFETKIQNLNQSLERQVAERTAQLRGLSQLQQAILENAGYAIIAADASGVITLFNPAAERMLGYRADEVVNRITPTIFHDPEEVATRAVEFSVELGEFVAPDFGVFIIKNLRGLPNEHEWTYINKNGQRFPVLLSVTALRDEDGKIFSFVGLAADLSERKREQIALQQLNQQLQIRTEEAESASRAKSEFLANMSHEIRTPMNAILGMLQLLQQSQLNAGQEDYASKAEKAARTLLSIINDILDFSRVEAGKLELDPHPFSMDNLLVDMEALLSAGIGNKDLVLTVKKDGDVPDQLIGDALRLQQILINLVGNAIKFTSHGEVALTLSLLEQDEQTVTLNFAVSDTGIGISEEQCKRIFEGFSQAEASTARRYGGSGLGLSISQRLVQLMQGSLHVESVQGQGSTFGFAVKFPRVMTDYIRVPALLESPPEGVELASSDNALPGARRLTGLCLLVVDDNTINQQVACELLRSVDAEVEVADGGLAAVQAISAAPDKFDAILMDIQMPDMDGYAATAEIRTTLGLDRLPIIAITANAMRSDRDKVIAAGMQDHVGKPFDLAQLIDVILYHCGRTDSPVHVAPSIETPVVSSEPVFDSAAALARLEGNTELYAMTLEGFAAEVEPLAQRLQQEVLEGQPLTIAASLHELRGIAAIAGAVRLAATAKRLELMLKQNPPADTRHWRELEAVDALIQEAIAVACQTAQSMVQKVQETQAEGSLPTLSGNVLTHHLMDLQIYLREGDLDAVVSFEQWFAEMDAVQTEKLAALEAAMMALDFPAALMQCQQLLERISSDVNRP